MKPKGTIVISNNNLHGSLKVSLTETEIKIYKSLRALGAILAGLAMASIVFFYGPTLVLEMDAITLPMGSNIALANKDLDPKFFNSAESSNPSPTPVPTARPVVRKQVPVVKAAVNHQGFSISIPKISANSKVIENVNPYNEAEYLNALKRGVAHAQGTGLPGQGRRIYLFAHSTNSPANFSRFNAVFYQLRYLNQGDIVTAHYNGVEFRYRVTAKHIVEATDTHWLTENGSGENIVLQTCDPPGTSLRRLLIVAEPV